MNTKKMIGLVIIFGGLVLAIWGISAYQPEILNAMVALDANGWVYNETVIARMLAMELYAALAIIGLFLGILGTLLYRS